MDKQLSFMVVSAKLREELFQLFGETQDQIILQEKYLPTLIKYEKGKDYIMTKGWRAEC